VLGHCESGRQQQLRGGDSGDGDGQRDSGESDDYVYNERSGERGLREQLYRSGEGQLGVSGGLHERGIVQQFERDLHNDQWVRDLFRYCEPVRKQQLCGGTSGNPDGECNPGGADDYVHDERSRECGLQQQLHGCRNRRRERQCHRIYECRIVQQLWSDVYDDERHRHVLRDRESGGEY
jgi:hypothetical protein